MKNAAVIKNCRKIKLIGLDYDLVTLTVLLLLKFWHTWEE